MTKITNLAEQVIETEIAKSNGTPKNAEEKRTMLMQKTLSPARMKQSLRLRETTMNDLEATFELMDICANHMMGQPETTLDHVRSEWVSPGFDLVNSTRVVEAPDGSIVGYIEVWDVSDPPVIMWVWGRVHPEYEGLGIGKMLMEWAERRARQAIPRAPEDARVIMRAGTLSSYRPASDLFQHLGMSEERHFFTMAIELNGEVQEPTWPEGITVRTIRGLDETKKVVLAVRDAFQDHWGYVERPFEQEYELWKHFIEDDKKFDETLWFLAMDGDEIAGVSLCNLESDQDPDMGWVSTLGVRRPWRRQGLGLALLLHSFELLRTRGKGRVGLGVDASSLTGATGLYKKAGMRSIRQFDTYEKELRPGRDLALREL